MSARQGVADTAVKRFLPRTLFGRALLIIVTPLLLMQAVPAYVFFERHLDKFAPRLGSNLAGGICPLRRTAGRGRVLSAGGGGYV